MSQVFPTSLPPPYGSIQRMHHHSLTIKQYHNSDPFYDSNFSKTPVSILSYVQLFLTLLLIISEIIGLKYPFNVYIYGSPGMLCAIIFGISGSFGVWASTHTSKCSIIAHMVFAVISALTCVPLIFYSIVASIVTGNEYAQGKAKGIIYNEYGMKEASNVYSAWNDRTSREYLNDDEYEILRNWKLYIYKFGLYQKITIAIFVTQAIIGLIQAGIAIASSIMTCTVICCRTKPPNSSNLNLLDSTTRPLVMSSRPVIWLSIFQIIAAIAAILLNIMGMCYPYEEEYAYFGTGIWTALPFTISGVLGILSGKKPSKCLIITFMVFAIISSFFCIPYFGVSVIGMATSSNAKRTPPPKPEPIKPIGRKCCHPGHPFSDNKCWGFCEGTWDKMKNIYNENEKAVYDSMKEKYDHWAKEDTPRRVTYSVFLLHTLISLFQIIILVNLSAMAFQPICCPTDVSMVQIQETVQIHPTASNHGPIHNTPRHQPAQINYFQVQNASHRTTDVPIDTTSKNHPFVYQSPKELVYLSSTHAEIGRGMKVQSSSQAPDIYTY